MTPPVVDENTETITIEDAKRANREFWSQAMEYVEIVYIGNGQWKIVDTYKTNKGSAEIQ